MPNPDDNFDQAMRRYFSESEKEALEICPVSERERHDRRRLIAQYMGNEGSRAAEKSSWLNYVIGIVMARRAGLGVLAAAILAVVWMAWPSASFHRLESRGVSSFGLPRTLNIDFARKTIKLGGDGYDLNGTIIELTNESSSAVAVFRFDLTGRGSDGVPLLMTDGRADVKRRSLNETIKSKKDILSITLSGTVQKSGVGEFKTSTLYVP